MFFYKQVVQSAFYACVLFLHKIWLTLRRTQHMETYDNQTHYYMVIAKCGHVGRRSYIPITFPVKAANAKEAAAIVRYYPRVKHDKKDAILKVTEIDQETYNELKEINSKDPYLHCKNKRDQETIIDLALRIEKETPRKQFQKYDRFARIKKKQALLTSYPSKADLRLQSVQGILDYEN